MKSASQALISISVTLATSLGLVVVIAVGVVLWIQWSTARLNTEELIDRVVGLIVNTVEELLAQELEPAIRQVEGVALRLESGEIDPSDTDSLALLLTASMVANPQFRSITYFDTAYQAVVARRDGSGAIEWEQRDGAEDRAVAIAVDEAFAAEAAFWGNPVFANGAVHANRRRPITIDGETVGVLAASVTVSELSRLISNFGQSFDGTGFILFGRNHVLAHPTLVELHPVQNADHPAAIAHGNRRSRAAGSGLTARGRPGVGGRFRAAPGRSGRCPVRRLHPVDRRLRRRSVGD